MRGIDVPIGNFAPPGRFGRMFPHLPPAPDSEELATILGDPEGPMRANGSGRANRNIAAGFTYLGQFIDHDLTFDPTSSLEKLTDPRAVENFRTPALELDSVYGGGPEGNPYFYEETAPIRFRLGEWERTDVPRLGRDKMAVIADARNDSNFFVSQLHTAFLNFHNYVVTRHEPDFKKAQRLVRWHYQWIVLKQYLPKIVGEAVLADCIERGARFYRPEGSRPFMPIEFSLAAFRFGHSQIRFEYPIRDGLSLIRLDTLFGPNAIERVKGPMDWQKIMPFPGGKPTHSRILGLLLVEPLMKLPNELIGRRPRREGARSDAEGTHPIPTQLARPAAEAQHVNDVDTIRSLAYRDIRRGQVFGLPSGTDVAVRMGLRHELVLSPDDVWGLINPRLMSRPKDLIPPDTPVPLWIYILAEAQMSAERNSAFGDGARLGPVGGRIVAEVILGLLAADSESFLSQDPKWKPTLGMPDQKPGEFEISDLLRRAEEGRKV